LRSLRHMRIRKMRGSRPINGQHTVAITDAGLSVHARFEARLQAGGVPSPRARHGRARAAFGIAELDRMMQGGPMRASTTMLLGSSGIGKTTLAAHFLATGAEAGEPGLFFGMYEQPEDLLDKCDRLGIPLRAGVAAGTIHVLWERPIEGVLDVLADQLITRVRETGAKRLVIDGMHSLFRTVDFPERMRAVSAALAETLTTLGVTTVYTLETPELIGTEHSPIRVPISDLSAMCHNLVALRWAERENRYDRLLAVLKMRDSDHDRSIRVMQITDHGVVVEARVRRAPERGGPPE
jgi:circadian clock protein KaiC